MSSEQSSNTSDGIPPGRRYEVGNNGKGIAWDVGDINPVSFNCLPNIAVLAWPTMLKPSEFLNTAYEILGIEKTPVRVYTEGPTSEKEISLDSLIDMDKAETKVPEVVRMDYPYTPKGAEWQNPQEASETDISDNPIRLIWQCFDGQSFEGGIFFRNLGVVDIRTLLVATGSDAVKANIDGLVQQVFLEDIILNNRLN